MQVLSTHVAAETTSPDLPRGCTHLKLRQLNRLVTQHYEHAMAPAGVKITQYSLLSALAKRDSLQPTELARWLRMDVSTLSRNLKPLIQAGLIEMLPGADARSRALSLTPEGKARRQQAQKLWRAAQNTLNDKLGVAFVAALHDQLDTAIGQFDIANEEEAE
jgi:DNA-binding MarR family transcriptional regulator